MFFTIGLISTDYWMGSWSIDLFKLTFNEYIMVWGLITTVVAITMFVRGWIFAKFTNVGSRLVFLELIRALLKTNYEWFISTPIGRIVARALGDQQEIDIF